jgi:alpha-mannosidase
MADGESIARHMLYAKDWTQQNLDNKSMVLWETDTFGHPGNMPQLAKLGEFDIYFHLRNNPGKENNWPIWKWTGIDGTPITCYSMGYGGGLGPDQIMYRTLEAAKFGFKNCFHMWGMGDHGGALSRHELLVLSWYIHKPVFPTVKFSTMKQLNEVVKQENAKLPGYKGHTYNSFEGCFTTHSSIKQYNRKCETALLTAESLSALAGINRNDVLRNAWTPILFSHFHDIFDGAAVHRSYIDAHDRAEKTLKTARKVISETAGLLTKKNKSGKTLVLLNGLSFNRTEPVRVKLPANTKCLTDSTGKIIPVQKFTNEFVFIAENVPALSKKTYKILTAIPKGKEIKPIAVIDQGDHECTYKFETNHYFAKFNKKSGTISSLIDKSNNKEFVGYGTPKIYTCANTTRNDLALNTYQIIDESPNGMAAWLIGDILKEENLLGNSKVTLVNAGTVFAWFKVETKFRSSTINQDVLFYNNHSRIDFDTKIDWHEKGDAKVGVPQLKVSFGTTIKAPVARYEGPFIVEQRAADGQEFPTQKWVNITGTDAGLTVYNDSKYGWDALGSRVRMTLLRNPYVPDPETDNGTHYFRYGIETHSKPLSNAILSERGMSFNRPLVPVIASDLVKEHKPMLIIDKPGSVICTSLRMAEHSNKLMLRFFEPNGKPVKTTVSFNTGIKSALEVNFLENPVGGKVTLNHGKLILTFRPYEVKTLLIDPNNHR